MREVRKTVAASGQEFVDAAGDFIFCSFADRPFRVIIDGQPVTVRVGDKIRPEKRFRSFQLENLDAVNPLAVTLVVGEGDYNSQIIQGEISILPGVRGADGTWRDDTRHTINVSLEPLRAFTKSFPAGTVVEKSAKGLESTIEGSLVGRNVAQIRIGQLDTLPGYLVAWVDAANPTGSAGVVYLGEDFQVLSVFDGGTGSWPVAYGNDVAEIGGVIYSISANNLSDVGGNVQRIMSWDPVTGEQGILYEMFAQQGQFVYSICPVDGALLAVTRPTTSGFTSNSGNKWYLISTGGEIIRQGDFPAGEPWHRDDKVRYFKKTGKAVLAINGNNSEVFEIDAKAGTMEVAPGPGNFLSGVRDGWVPKGSLVTRLDLAESQLLKVVYESLESPLDVLVMSGPCTQFNRITRNLSAFPKLITADLTVSEDLGAVRVRGEVIRAALEYYFNRPVLDGYMDHVYDFVAANDPYGSQKLQSFGGAQTLQREGVADNYTVTLPTSFSITIDNGLPLGNYGEF